jgi:hypothetical protein
MVAGNLIFDWRVQMSRENDLIGAGLRPSRRQALQRTVEDNWRQLARGLLFALTLSMVAPIASASEADAKAILKSMSDYVGGQQAIDLTFDSDIEVITPKLEKLQFTSSGELSLSRPNKLRARRTGGYADVSLYFDGKTASVHGHNLNAYASFEAPGTVDQLIQALRDGHGVALPGADLLLTNSYEVLMADVTEAKHIGRGVIDGVECEHVAFRNFDTDWQLWVEVGKRPFPRKLVVTSKTINSAPQYTLRIKSWKSGEKHASTFFTFKPTKGMTQLGADELIGLDELPPESAPGDDQ